MSKRRNRPGRMLSRELRRADRLAVAAHEEAIGPEEVARRADVAELDAYSSGLSTRPVDIAQAWIDETDDPGWGIDRAACARQYERLTGRALTRAEAESAIDADADEEWIDS